MRGTFKKRLVLFAGMLTLVFCTSVFALAGPASAEPKPLTQVVPDYCTYEIPEHNEYISPRKGKPPLVYTLDGITIKGPEIVGYSKTATEETTPGTGVVNYEILMHEETRDGTVVQVDLNKYGSGSSGVYIYDSIYSVREENPETKVATFWERNGYWNFAYVKDGECSIRTYLYPPLPDIYNEDITQSMIVMSGGIQYNFHFKLAPRDTAADPDPEDVQSLEIVSAPRQLYYQAGESFRAGGMEVRAVLQDGTGVPVEGYTVEPAVLSGDEQEVLIRFGEAVVSCPIKTYEPCLIPVGDTYDWYTTEKTYDSDSPWKHFYGTLDSLRVTGAPVRSYEKTETETISGRRSFIYDLELEEGVPEGTVLEVRFNFTREHPEYAYKEPLWLSAYPLTSIYTTDTNYGDGGTGISFPSGLDPYSYPYGIVHDVCSAVVTNGQCSANTFLWKAHHTFLEDGHVAIGTDAILYTFNFRPAGPDTSNDPAPEDVASLEITKLPDKTQYSYGEFFFKQGMEVTATLKDGTTRPVVGYSFEPGGALTLEDTEITVSYGNARAVCPISVTPAPVLLEIKVLNGQLARENSLFYEIPDKAYKFTENRGSVMIRYGEEKGKFNIKTLPGVEVYIGDEKQETDAQGNCYLELPTGEATGGEITGIFGIKSAITLKYGERTKEYPIACCSQLYSGMPDAVTDYLCLASQYTNGNGSGPYGVNGVGTLRGGVGSTGAAMHNGPASLGNFGGYLVYYYEEPITDDPTNPYGVDFIIEGNSVDGTAGFAEPGNVLVSEDGENWYNLAGSVHYDDVAVWGFSMTYKRNPDGSTSWTDSLGGSSEGIAGVVFDAPQYPVKEYYPLYHWTAENDQAFNVSGVLLTKQTDPNQYGNTLPVYPDFGYVDVNNIGNTNVAVNIYEGLKGRNVEGDHFDLAWAVDSEGMPVTFASGIHYIKVQSACNILNGGIGEKSTEVCMMRRAESTDHDVGITAAPQRISVAGRDIPLEAGQNIYTGVQVAGSFTVEVEAEPGSNVYINGARGASRSYAEAPDKKLLRIIVQKGEAAPSYYFIHLEEQGAALPVITRDLTAEQGSCTQYQTPAPLEIEASSPDGGELSYQWFESRTSNTSGFLPIEGAVGPSYVPPTDEAGLRWYYVRVRNTSPDGTQSDQFSRVKPFQVSKAPSGAKIKVSFTLLGALPHDGDPVYVYVNDQTNFEVWIPETEYEVPEEAVVIDVFAQALTANGLSWINEGIPNGTDGDYISSIEGMAEFTNGPYSGWVYLLNDKYPHHGVKDQKLQDGDDIIFHYTDDYWQEWDEIWMSSYEVHYNLTNLSYEGRVTVNGHDQFSAVLKAAQGYRLPETITVVMADKQLVAGEDYTYLDGVISIDDVLGEITITAEGVKDSALWDGSIDASWYDHTAAELEIATPAQLAGLAAIVNGTAVDGENNAIAADNFDGKTIMITADLDLNNQEWTPVSLAKANAFKGTLDGNNKRIRNLKIDDPASNRRALFSYNEGTIKNLSIASGAINGRGYAGSFVGTNAGTLQNCSNRASVNVNGNSAGGLVAENTGGNIINCANYGAVTGDERNYVGGIAGNVKKSDSPSAIINCYNSGTITGGRACGGLAGQAETDVEIKNSYNAGRVTTLMEPTGAFIGVCNFEEGSFALENNFYLRTQGINQYLLGIGVLAGATLQEGQVTRVDSAGLKSPETLAALGDGYAADINNINSGYPVLKWQAEGEPITTYSVTVTNGTADKETYAAGEMVRITANMPPEGQEFDKWTTEDGIGFADANSPATSFTMPEKAVTVVATYKGIPVYSITVENGTSDKPTATEGEGIIITADPAPEGQEFDKWITEDGVTFGNANLARTIFIMPARNVTATATYKDQEGTGKARVELRLPEESLPEGAPFEIELWLYSVKDVKSGNLMFNGEENNVLFRNATDNTVIAEGSFAGALQLKEGLVLTESQWADREQWKIKWNAPEGLEIGAEGAKIITLTMQMKEAGVPEFNFMNVAGVECVLYNVTGCPMSGRIYTSDDDYYIEKIEKIITRIPAGGGDTAPPLFDSGYPKAENVTAAGFDLLIRLDEPGTAYYKAVTGGSEPGSDYAGWTSVAIPGTDTVTAAVYGLAAGTAYDIHVIAVDTAGNWQTAPVKLEVSTPEETDPAAPRFAAGYPRAANITATGFQLQVKLSVAGAVYYKTVPGGTPIIPEPGQSVAQAVYRNPDGSLSLPGLEEAGVFIGGLAAGAAYDIYVIAVDTDGNWQTAPVKLEVRTLEEGPTGFVIERVGSGDFELGADARVVVKITNNNPAPQPATLIVCLYDNERSGMANYSYLFRTLAAGEEVDLAGGFPIPATGDYTVKAFVWDSFENMEPLLETPLVIDVD